MEWIEGAGYSFHARDSRLPELGGRYLRVVTLEDKVTLHDAFLDRGFEP